MKKTILLSSIIMCALCCFSGARGMERVFGQPVPYTPKETENFSTAPTIGDGIIPPQNNDVSKKNVKEQIYQILDIVRANLGGWKENNYKNPTRDTIIHLMGEKFEELSKLDGAKNLGVGNVSSYFEVLKKKNKKDEDLCKEISRLANRFTWRISDVKNFRKAQPDAYDIIHEIIVELVNCELNSYESLTKDKIIRFIDEKLNDLNELDKADKVDHQIKEFINRFNSIKNKYLNHEAKDLYNKIINLINSLTAAYI